MRVIDMMEKTATSIENWFLLTSQTNTVGLVIIPGWGNGVYKGMLSLNREHHLEIAVSFP